MSWDDVPLLVVAVGLLVAFGIGDILYHAPPVDWTWIVPSGRSAVADVAEKVDVPTTAVPIEEEVLVLGPMIAPLIEGAGVYGLVGKIPRCPKERTPRIITTITSPVMMR